MTAIPQPFRYAAVSGLCLGLSMLLIPLLSISGLHYALATFIAFCIIAVVGFFLHSLWTFSVPFRFSSFAMYVSALAINLPLTVLLIAIAHDLARFDIAISTAFASAVLFIWNYLAARWAVLRPSGAKK